MSNLSDVPDFGPVEDLLLGIFRRYFAGMDVEIDTEFHEGMGLPAIVARADRRSGTVAFSSPDDRFMKPQVISVSAICEGPNADADASHLIEAARIALRVAEQQQWVVPFVGHIAHIENSTPAARASDWATSTGVVQYASLPKGATRYEAIFRLMLRPPKGGSRNPFIASA